ncbi:MAG: GDP-mannose 4,6-dehydratase [Candidatus Pacebacteria bacterium]|nr:GDP-mannose 4,6-dehydratase [Candidatus Paceibacterota bacterium]
MPVKKQKPNTQTILVTGSAGFIGFHTAKQLLESGHHVIGMDNFNIYYDYTLKEARNAILEDFPNFTLYRGNIEDIEFLRAVFESHTIDKVIHLAAQAGVRYSIENPHVYIQSNIVGFINILEEMKRVGIKDFIFASSSSVYGENKKVPFSEMDRVDHPISLYAATKKSNEKMAFTYSHLHGMRCTGLRFFTVYGPWGRPDMALFKFTHKVLLGEEIEVYGHGRMMRDFTYIDDIVSGIIRSLEKPASFEIFNLGRGEPVKLNDFIKAIGVSTGMKVKKKKLPMQPGDVTKTYADISKAKKKLGYKPKTSIDEGVKNFVDWYREYYKR